MPAIIAVVPSPKELNPALDALDPQRTVETIAKGGGQFSQEGAMRSSVREETVEQKQRRLSRVLGSPTREPSRKLVRR